MTHFINNQWLDGAGPEFTSISPATLQTIWQGRAASADQINDAVRAARAALTSWSTSPLEARIQILQRYADLLKRETLLDTIAAETGKPLWDSRGELTAMINKIPISIDALHNRRSDSHSTKDGVNSATRYKPHGVVAVFGPFNFPGHLPNGHIVPALLAGNTIVFKPSELTPRTAHDMVRLWDEAGLPPGVLNLVQGPRETGAALASHRAIDGVFFTGSVAGGQAIARLVPDALHKILALEMGGNNPLIVWNASDLTAAAMLIIQSAYMSSGQRCSCARRLIVEERHADALIARLLDIIPKIRIGAPHDQPQPFMGPLIRPEAAARALEAQQKLLDAGARALLTSRNLELETRNSAFLSPSLIDVTRINIPDEEIFAPILQLIRTDSFDNAIRIANHTRFGLAAGLVSDDPALYQTFFAQIRAGVVNFNRPTTGASSALPFGGIGLSGNHRPSAYFAADYCSYPIASMEQPKPTVSPITGIDV